MSRQGLPTNSKDIYAHSQARNQGGHLGHLTPSKFSKHCMAILTFAETFK